VVEITHLNPPTPPGLPFGKGEEGAKGGRMRIVPPLFERGG